MLPYSEETLAAASVPIEYIVTVLMLLFWAPSHYRIGLPIIRVNFSDYKTLSPRRPASYQPSSDIGLAS